MKPKIKTLAILSLSLAGCATGYYKQNVTGGFSDFMVSPNEAIVMFKGNGFTDADRVVSAISLRSADLTLEHGYRYYITTEVVDTSSQSSFVVPGHSQTYNSAFTDGSASIYGNSIYGSATTTGTSTTTFTPAQRININRPGLSNSIKMSNDIQSLEPFGVVINGRKSRPKDAAFLSKSLRQYLNVKEKQKIEKLRGQENQDRT